MYSSKDYERLLVKYSQIQRVRSLGSSTKYSPLWTTMTTDNEDNSRKTNSELKEVILDLFDQIRGLNARLVEKDRANAEKDRMISSLTEKLDTVLDNQRQQRLDLESWLAKERRWNKEREDLLKTIKDLNDIVKILKKTSLISHC